MYHHKRNSPRHRNSTLSQVAVVELLHGTQTKIDAHILIATLLAFTARFHDLDSDGLGSIGTSDADILVAVGGWPSCDLHEATRKGGNVALIGDFFYTTNNFPIGMLMEKAITLRGGQLYAEKVCVLCVRRDWMADTCCSKMQYFPFLLNLITPH